MTHNKEQINIETAVLLLNWNGVELTIPCIESLQNGTIKPTKIFVVDNASIDDSVYILKENYPFIDLIQNETNLGFTGGNNVGFEKILNNHYDYIWVLNNDTLVDEHCLCNLIETMETDKTIAATSGKIFYDDPSDVIWYAGSTLNKFTLRSKHKGELEKDNGQYNTPEDVPFISGCCMFIRRNALEQVGGFDNNFFAYSEDLDWCLRANKLNLRLRYTPEAIIYHKVSASFKKTTSNKNGGTSSPFAIYLSTRNRIYIIRKHSIHWIQFLSAIIHCYFWNCYYVFALTLLFRFKKAKSVIKAIYDGCFKKIITF